MNAGRTRGSGSPRNSSRPARLRIQKLPIAAFIDEQPGHAVARFNFACFLRRRGRLEEALEEHQSALDLQIDHPEEVLSNMAVIQAELRRDAAAKLLLERALAVNPNYIPAMFNLALQHEEYGDRKTAIRFSARSST